ncbi:532_t:CDS:2 [Diversispora eburnea]|uniref:532_t:CDS:1 n=1 Tax=Diversispora eburnea TaxID=1213867 RepID=A0A9N9AYR9_9GLOM|nr:532_t:CDS:2 [Diversispora eburnea]
MLFGRHPFYDTDRSFPDDIEVSHAAKNLISGILNPDYNSRLTLTEIRRHFFFRGPTPVKLPISALWTAPNYDDVLSKSEQLTGTLNPRPKIPKLL